MTAVAASFHPSVNSGPVFRRSAAHYPITVHVKPVNVVVGVRLSGMGVYSADHVECFKIAVELRFDIISVIKIDVARLESHLDDHRSVKIDSRIGNENVRPHKIVVNIQRDEAVYCRIVPIVRNTGLGRTCSFMSVLHLIIIN